MINIMLDATSRQGDSLLKYKILQLDSLSTTLDDAILQRIRFLQEQLVAENNADNIRTFQAQIRILQTAQLDRLDELISIRRKDLQTSKNIFEADRLFAELDALEWLQGQAQRTN